VANLHCQPSWWNQITWSSDWYFWSVCLFTRWILGPQVTLHDCLSAFFSADELKGVLFSWGNFLSVILCVGLKTISCVLLSKPQYWTNHGCCQSSDVQSPIINKILDLYLYTFPLLHTNWNVLYVCPVWKQGSRNGFTFLLVNKAIYFHQYFVIKCRFIHYVA